jgi:hypothetical protein
MREKSDGSGGHRAPGGGAGLGTKMFWTNGVVGRGPVAVDAPGAVGALGAAAAGGEVWPGWFVP